MAMGYSPENTPRDETYSRIPELPIDDPMATPRDGDEKAYCIDKDRLEDYGLGPNLNAQDISACLGCAKAINILGEMEQIGACAVERTSVYGVALAVPQIARSARWPKTMICLAFRAYLFVVLNYIIQTMFVYYIYDSQTNMNPYGGQMHLCDFASHVAKCPDKPDCHGPGGQEIPNPGSLYPYDIWNTRKFMRDGMMILFPDRKDDIASNLDPGEYGVESYYCRLLCIFVFMVAIADEFQNIRDLVKLLYNLPTQDLSWVSYDPPTWSSKQHVKDVHGMKELSFVRFTVNGMPLRWKVFNMVFLLVPKIFIWRMLTMAGVHFLMETAAMVDQIVNTTALSFVFTTDELILERLTTKATKHIMTNLEDYELFDHDHYESESDQEALERYARQEMNWFKFSHRDWWLLPRRLFWSFVLMVLFLAEYYWHNCRRMDDGSVVSTDQYYPPGAHLDIWCFVGKFFSYAHSYGGDDQEAFWTMPDGPGGIFEKYR